MKNTITLLTLLFATLTLRPTPSLVAGDCLYDCETSTCADFSNHSSMCNDTRARCLAKCSQPGANGASWGAIAYSAKDQGAGWSFGWADLAKAKKIALDNCSSKGAECKLWLYFNNECGALAADGNTVTWGTSAIKRNADQRALLECSKAGGKKCVIQVSQCSLK